MKNSIIEDIYFGRRGSDVVLKTTEKTKKLMNEAIEYEDSFKKVLSAEQLSLFERYISSVIDLKVEELCVHYTEGFKLGLLVGIQCAE